MSQRKKPGRFRRCSMSYQIETTPTFDRAVKRLLKKYRHLKGDLLSLAAVLVDNPFAGVAIPGYSHAV